MCALALTYQCDVNGELHSDAHRGDQNDHRDGAQLDADQTHDAEQLHCHHGQDKHLRRRHGKCYKLNRNFKERRDKTINKSM